jgi:hypothetical protein
VVFRGALASTLHICYTDDQHPSWLDFEVWVDCHSLLLVASAVLRVHNLRFNTLYYTVWRRIGRIVLLPLRRRYLVSRQVDVVPPDFLRVRSCCGASVLGASHLAVSEWWPNILHFVIMTLAIGVHLIGLVKILNCF